MERLCSILVACKLPFGEVTPNSTMVLEAPRRLLPHEMTFVVVTMIVCDWLPLLFLSHPSLEFHDYTSKKIKFILLFYDVSGLILNVHTIMLMSFDR